MKSKFPGMDPYLEGADWSDVYNSLAYVIARQLTPQLRPKYFARIEKYVVTDTEPQLNMGIVYPDLDVWKKPPETLREPDLLTDTDIALTPPTATFPFSHKVNVPIIEIKDKESNQLITTIEIISPANKRQPGYIKYVEKQSKLHRKGINLLEIDLIRKGERRFLHQLVETAHYIATLMRGVSDKVDIWAIDIKNTLPVVPVPLKLPDDDAVLDLQKAFDEMYEERGYADSINYGKTPPPPAFTKEEQKWINTILTKEST